MFKDFFAQIGDYILEWLKYRKEYNAERRSLKLQSAKLNAQLDHIAAMERKKRKVESLKGSKVNVSKITSHLGKNPMEVEF